MMLKARLDKTGKEVRCIYCNTKIADMVEGPWSVDLTAWKGPVVECKELEPGHRLPYLVNGIVWDGAAGLWQLGHHAKKGQEHGNEDTAYKRRGNRMAPADYPAPVRCPSRSCRRIQELDEEALRMHPTP